MERKNMDSSSDQLRILRIRERDYGSGEDIWREK